MRIRSLLVLALGSWAAAAGAEEFRYRYVSLNEPTTLPEDVEVFHPAFVTERGGVIGTAYKCARRSCDVWIPHIAVYRNDTVRITNRRGAIAFAVNASGLLGGCLENDPEESDEQSALFRGNRVERIPRLPGEVSSCVVALSDSGSALVSSFDTDGQRTFALYKDGESTVLDFGPDVTNPSQLAINASDVISGTQGEMYCLDETGFRFDTRSGDLTLLAPRASEPVAWGLDINARGQVLGYSFSCGGGPERIGLWDRNGSFRPYFVQQTRQYPQQSAGLLFNDDNLIVITSVYADGEENLYSYLVPEPGVRLNLADFVQNLPAGVHLSKITHLNERGDMIGWDWTGSGPFLLKRVGPVQQ